MLTHKNEMTIVLFYTAHNYLFLFFVENIMHPKSMIKFTEGHKVKE